MGSGEVLHDLLKEGVAIQYDRQDGVMMVWIPDRTVGTLTRVVELLGECFGIDPAEVEVHPTTDEADRLRLEFPYSFEGRQESKEGKEEEGEDRSEEVDEGGWIDLTDSMAYLVEGDILRLGHKKDGRVSTVLKIPMEQLRMLYDRLPEEADSSDVRKVAAELDLSITGFETYIMRVLSRRAEFGGELVKEGRTLKLIKDSDYLREENRRRFEQEKQVIGTPWGADA